jgi:cation/acetate symporter
MGPEAIFPLKNPGIISIPLGFLGAYLGTILTSDKISQEKYSELYVRSQTGLGAE